MKRTLIALLLALAVWPAAADASSRANTLGPAPEQADCLTYHVEGRGCYYDIGCNLEYTISPHIARVGDKITGTASYSPCFHFGWGWTGAPPGTKVVECTPPDPGQATAGTCTYEATGSTNGWRPGTESHGTTAASGVFFGAALFCCTIGRYVDGDYLAVLGPDEEAIDGFARDHDGEPLEGYTVFIRGTTASGEDVDVFAEGDDTGYYNAILERGEYTVSAYDGLEPLCLASVTTHCRRRARVTPTTSLDFRENVNARIVGTVTSQQTGRGLANIALTVTDAIGTEVATAVTDASGNYAVDLEEARLYTVRAAEEGTGLTPPSRDVDAVLGEDVRADFTVDSGLTLTLDAPAWRPGDDFFTVDMTLANTGDDTLDDITFAQDTPLIISNAGYPDDPGGLVLLAGPVPSPPSSLAAGEEVGLTFGIAASTPGRAAVFSKAYAENAAGDRESDGHTLRVTIASDPVTDGLGRQLQIDAAESLLTNSQQALYNETEKAGNRLYERGRRALSASEERAWYGARNRLRITPYEQAIARQRGVAPELVAASLPNEPVRAGGETYTAEELNAIHDRTFLKQVGEGVRDYATGLGGAVSSAAKGAWADATLTTKYMLGQASAEERLQFEATMTAFAENNDSAFGTIRREVIDGNTYAYAAQATVATFDDVTLRSQDLQQQIAQETVIQENIARLADDDPVGYQKAMAEYDAGWVNTVTPTVMNTILGGITQRAGGVLFRGKGGAVVTAEKAAERAGVTAPPGPEIPPHGGASGYELAAIRAEGGIARTGQSLAEVSQAGGLPVENIQRLQGHLALIEGEIDRKFGRLLGGQPSQIGAGMKPLNGTPKAGAAPKFELLKTKNGTELDLKLGMPKEGLAEPVYYRPRDPTTLPGWDRLPTVERNALQARYKLMAKEWADVNSANPTPGTAKVVRAMQGRTEVPLSHGRTAVAEFEKNSIGRDAFTVRAKHYEVRNPGQSEGTVFLSSRNARPMTYDPDGVALFNARSGTRFPRAVENYLTLRLRQLVARDIQAGAASVSEHGFTLIMDDAGRLAAGDLVQHGAKFLNERTARAWLERIAPFTGKTVEQMLGEGFEGFGQRVTVITSSDAFFGELPITQW